MTRGEGPGGLDAIARDLATGAISRRAALRRFGGVAVAAMLPGALFAEDAFARCPKDRRCAGKCCPRHAHCKHGKCRCDKGFTKCGKKCRNLRTDPLNCGQCGNACAEGQACIGGTCSQCTTAADCPVPANECEVATCNKGICGTAYADQGTPVSDQTAGDCQQNVCDGSGQVVQVGDDTDTPSSTQCATGSCLNGVALFAPLPPGTPCNENGGNSCNGSGSCVQATCSDGIKNGTETDVDCGGICPNRCGTGQMCLQDSDCQSMQCVSGICA